MFLNPLDIIQLIAFQLLPTLEDKCISITILYLKGALMG